jgi:hypothetical protein
VRDDVDLALFLVVLRELRLAELNPGPEALLVLARALLTVLRAVFVALLTLLVRDSGLLLLELDELFRLPDRVLADEALFLRMLADLAPLDTLATLLLLFPCPPFIFTSASSLPKSLAT